VSLRGEPGWDEVQRQLLERERVRFDAAGRVQLSRYQWQPRLAARRERSR
jgi:alkylated DNA nucleotide flippase Atl1